MALLQDYVKIKALGRQFNIGSLYNYVEDIVVPNIRLWDADDVSKLATIKAKAKRKANVHKMAAGGQEDGEESDEEEDPGASISDLGADNHSAVSLLTGLVGSSCKGAWQYVVDRSSEVLEPSVRDTEVVVHCYSTTKKLSVDPNQLEIICRPERIVKTNATHVVVAITYGLEAFCVFSSENSQQKVTCSEDDSIVKNLLDNARHFANGLIDGQKRLNEDDEGDQDDGHLLSLNCLKCVLYSDLISAKSGRYVTSPVALQYEACRMVMEHQSSTAVPLSVWLYPLHKLMSDREGFCRMPAAEMDIDTLLINRCQRLLERMQRVRSASSSLAKEFLDLKDNGTIPLSIWKRVKDFDELIATFLSAFRTSLSQWILSIRRGDGISKKILEKIIDMLENNSPLVLGELMKWLNHQKMQVKVLNTLMQLPAIRLVYEMERLNVEVKNAGTVAVVLHLPSLIEQSFTALMGIKQFVGNFQKSSPVDWMDWNTKTTKLSSSNPLECRSVFNAARQFSNWALENQSETKPVKYFVCYCDLARDALEPLLPCKTLFDGVGLTPSHFEYPAAPEQVTVISNRRGVLMLRWPAVQATHFTGYLLQYRSLEQEQWQSVTHTSNFITINYLQSDETYVFQVATLTLGGRSAFGPVSPEVTVDPVCLAPFGLHEVRVSDTSITIAWEHGTIDYVEALAAVEEEEEDITDGSDTSDSEWQGEEEEEEEAEEEEEEEEVGEEEEEEEDKSKDSAGYYSGPGDLYKQPIVTITSYAVECWAAGNEESEFIQRSTADRTITLEPLLRGTTYCIQVRAVCHDDKGSIFYSPACPVMQFETLLEPERAALAMGRISQLCQNPGQTDVLIYKLPVKEEIRGKPTPGVSHYVLGEPSYLSLVGKHRRRTILTVGATGSGKSTLINAMVNYMLGVQWDDSFRFKLIDEPAEVSQAHSQTQLITTYDLYQVKGSRLDYSLTVVDTPGFGDTQGVEKDRKIMEQIQTYFGCKDGIQQLEAVCFVVQSSLPRLTATQKYIFESILSIFGQDIKDNVRLMVTFSDNAVPPVLDAVKEAGIPMSTDPVTKLPSHHKFNSSVFFMSNLKDKMTNEFNQTYFDLAVQGFKRFFDDLSKMETKSLTLTREVLDERKRLDALVEGLQVRTQLKLTRVDELEQMKKILASKQDQMEANKDFEFEVEILVPKATDISRTGQFTTNCSRCVSTCHFPCRQASDDNKSKCSVMDQKTGKCIICKCPWNIHYNQKYRYELVQEKVKRSSEAIRKQYEDAQKEAVTNQQLLDHIQREIKEKENELDKLMKATIPCIQRLEDIALQPHSFSATEYIDLMITTEEKDHRQGYQQRIVTLRKLRQMAEIRDKLVKDQRISINRRMSSAPQATSTTSSPLKRRLSSGIASFETCFNKLINRRPKP